MAESITGVKAFVDLKSTYVALYGQIGKSSTGQPLPRMTAADRWVILGIMAVPVAKALEANVEHGRAISMDQEQAHTSGFFDEVNITQAIAGGDTMGGRLAQRSIVDWLWGRKTDHYLKRAVPGTLPGVETPWYLWPKGSSSAQAIDRATKAWDSAYAQAKAPRAASGVFLTLAETEAFWGTAYDLMTLTISRGYVMGTSTWHEVVQTGKEAAKDIAESGADAAGKAAAFAANTAGMAAGTAIDAFLSEVGLWGVALIVSYVVATKVGLL